MKRNAKTFSLNGAGTSLSNKLGSMINGDDALDKRVGKTGIGKTIEGVSNIINTASAIGETVSNMLGNRNPYYIIGEIPEDAEWGKTAEKYLGGVGSAVRAVSKLWYGAKQEGVIIDCLGDIDGESSVEFTQNPIMYVTNGITDSRMRKPATVSAVVAVSNYNSDSIIESVVGSVLGGLDATGGFLTNSITNNLFYGGNTRAQYALYRLRWLMENGSPFTVHTPHGIYENMLIKSIKPKTDATNMDMLYATIEFEEIIMYSTYIQTTDGKNLPKRPARKGVTQGKSSMNWLLGR